MPGSGQEILRAVYGKLAVQQAGELVKVVVDSRQYLLRALQDVPDAVVVGEPLQLLLDYAPLRVRVEQSNEGDSPLL
jgi:hypothetical protein